MPVTTNEQVTETQGGDVEVVIDELAPIDENGKKFGRYKLCFELASGGMATVFLARAEGAAGFEKLVALKRIHPHLAKERSFVEMFLDEARIASRINHPNVCSVFDFGEVHDTYYISMEHLVGEPFSRVIYAVSRDADRRARFTPIAARAVADACEGLHAAHELRDARGEPLHVVHRDVSGSNIFVSYDGSVRIVDFGIARARDRMHQTATGTVKGRFSCMSPEQLRGHEVDRRADIWSLGVVLWQALTARKLFRRKSDSETILAVLNSEIPPPSKYNSSVPAELDAIVLKALTRDPDERYATAREMGRALSAYLGKRSMPVALADVADWMDELFPEEQGRKQQMIELAAQAETPVPTVHESHRPPPSYPWPTPVTPATIGSRSMGRWTALAATVLVLAGAAVAAATSRDSVVDEPPLLSAPPAPSHAMPGAAPLLADTESDTSPEQDQAAAEQAAAEQAAAEQAAAEQVAAEQAATEQAAAEQAAAEQAAAEQAPRRRARANRRRAANRSRARSPQGNESAVAGSGTVNVVTPGVWAEVWWRSRRVAHTPGSFELPAGSHWLEVRPFGLPQGQRVRVRVTPGQRERVTVRIQR